VYKAASDEAMHNTLCLPLLKSNLLGDLSNTREAIAFVVGPVRQREQRQQFRAAARIAIPDF
jgi:hypothetical protein